MKSGDQIDQPPGLGDHNNRLVKLEILAGIPLGILLGERLLEPQKAGLQLGQVAFVDLASSQIGGQALQILSNQEKLEDVLFGKPDDEGTSLRKNFHQALLFQPVDGFAHGRSTDAQGLGQLAFIQLSSRRNPPFQYDAFQLLVGLVS